MHIAILDDYEEASLKMGDWGSLGSETKIDVYRDHLVKEDEIVDRLLPYDILVIMRERTPFPRDLIQQLPNLKLIVTKSLRNRAIDLAACTEKGIVVSGTDAQKGGSADELTWGLILSLLRRIPQEDCATRKGRWGSGMGTCLSGKILGVLGLGRLGTKVTRVGLAFGMKVVAWSQNLTPKQAYAAGAVRVEKDELFANSDVISIHLILSDRTRGLIGAHEIGLMKPSAYIINTSRGPIIEEEALIDALREGRIAGAGLDVFETEPLPPDHPFLTLPNTVITPHIGFVTKESFQSHFNQVIEDVAAWLAGKPIRVLEPSK
jgi:phosphoglycerate dehydrogenase-like enzyme